MSKIICKDLNGWIWNVLREELASCSRLIMETFDLISELSQRDSGTARTILISRISIVRHNRGRFVFVDSLNQTSRRHRSLAMVNVSQIELTKEVQGEVRVVGGAVVKCCSIIVTSMVWPRSMRLLCTFSLAVDSNIT